MLALPGDTAGGIRSCGVQGMNSVRMKGSIRQGHFCHRFIFVLGIFLPHLLIWFFYTQVFLCSLTCSWTKSSRIGEDLKALSNLPTPSEVSGKTIHLLPNLFHTSFPLVEPSSSLFWAIETQHHLPSSCVPYVHSSTRCQFFVCFIPSSLPHSHRTPTSLAQSVIILQSHPQLVPSVQSLR